MKELLKIFLTVSLMISCIGFLLFTAKYTGVPQKERSIQQECIDKGGLMIPRTYVCVNNESVIKLESLK